MEKKTFVRLDKERIQKQSMGSQIKKEIAIMKQLRHPHVVRLREVLASRTKIFIVLELVTGGELFDLIVKSGRLTEDEARPYFRQLVEGVSYCHSQGVAHRDLKPENLLLDENMKLRISDFGLSALYDGENGSSRSELLHTTCGTPNYVAPEVLQNEGYDGAVADCWSVGVILYVLLAGFLPFDENTMSALFAKIKDAEYAYPQWFSTLVIDLIDGILVADPKDRKTLDQVQTHDWFTMGQKNKIEEETSAPAAAVIVEDNNNNDSSSSSKTILHKKGSTRVVDFNSALAPQETLAELKKHLLEAKCTVKEDNNDKNNNNYPAEENIDNNKKNEALLDENNMNKHEENNNNKNDDNNKEVASLEATLNTPNGLLSLTARAWPRKDGGSHLHLLRVKGDILAFSNFQAALVVALKPCLLL